MFLHVMLWVYPGWVYPEQASKEMREFMGDKEVQATMFDEPKVQLGDSNQIRVNAVALGIMQTELLKDALADIGASEEAIGRRIPLGRCANPEEIAEIVFWLASDRASYVTGIVMPVEGGYLLM